MPAPTHDQAISLLNPVNPVVEINAGKRIVSRDSHSAEAEAEE